MRVTDTSFLYALFSETDDFHQKALKMVSTPGSISIPSEILAETLALVQYRHGFETAKGAGEWIRRQDNIELGTATPLLLQRAWRIFLSGRGKLAYPDAIVLSWCETYGARPLAFDKAILHRLSR